MIEWFPIRRASRVVAYASGGTPIPVTPDPIYKGCIVTYQNATSVFRELSSCTVLSLDTETTGLYPYKGDHAFAVVIANSEGAFYFDREIISGLNWQDLFGNPKIKWVLFNAKFDMHFLGEMRFELAGEVFDVKSGARLEFNDHMQYNLAVCAEREGLEKSREVDDYIREHGLYRRVKVPGKDVTQRIREYDKVPLDIIRRYACQDAIITRELAKKLDSKLAKKDTERPENAPSLLQVALNENKLIKTVFAMERTGLKINSSYVVMALNYERGREEGARKFFAENTGKDYLSSPKLFAEIFTNQKDKWEYTEKGNPSFTSDVLAKFSGPVAKAILIIRDAKSRQDFYNSFLFYMDDNQVVHPNLDPSGTATGRFSSSAPNFQNLTSEEEEAEYLIRRAIIPHNPGDYLVAIDYDQQEYRLMLDYAGQMDLIKAIVEDGLDVHEATAKLMGVTRKEAKTLNFMLLYGGGAQKLADALGITLEKAKELKSLYFSKLPRVRQFINAVTETAKNRGYVFNWFGRRLHFPNPEHAYRAPNAVIQGGGADVTKVALNRIHEQIVTRGLKTRLILTVHDEIVLNVPRDEVHFIPEVKDIMEKAYPFRNIPLTCSVSYSQKSLADPDMTEGLPA